VIPGLNRNTSFPSGSKLDGSALFEVFDAVLSLRFPGRKAIVIPWKISLDNQGES